MNRPAIDDLLGSILSTWCESVAEWAPPGQLSAVTCVECRHSALATVINIGDWPHDLMHQLSTALDSATITIAESIEVDSDPRIREKYQAHLHECPEPFIDCVRQHVVNHVGAQRADLLDVLDECVTPRLDDWIASQAITLTPHLRG